MTTTPLRHSTLHAGVAALLLALNGDAANAQPQGIDAGGSSEWHYRVMPGDTLSGIAERHLFDPDAWHLLQQHNRITDPRRLQPGQVLRAPRDWLRTAVGNRAAVPAAAPAPSGGSPAPGATTPSPSPSPRAGAAAALLYGPALAGPPDTPPTPQRPFAASMRPPSLPVLPAPVVLPSATQLAYPPPRIDWQPVAGATRYRAQVFKVPPASTPLYDTIVDSPSARWTNEPLLPDGRYLLRLRAIDAAGSEGQAREVPFTVAMRPFAPQPQRPREGAVIGGDAANLRWDLQPGVLRYRLQIAASSDFAEPLRDRIVVGSDTAVTLPPGVYHWRVAAMGNDGAAAAAGAAAPQPQRNGPFSTASVFELRAMPPLPEFEPVQFSPDNLLLRWRPTAAGQGLQIQIASDPAFEQIVFDERTWGAQMQIARPPAGRYHVRMRSWIGDESAGEFGPVQLLDIGAVPFWERW